MLLFGGVSAGGVQDKSTENSSAIPNPMPSFCAINTERKAGGMKILQYSS